MQVVWQGPLAFKKQSFVVRMLAGTPEEQTPYRIAFEKQAFDLAGIPKWEQFEPEDPIFLHTAIMALFKHAPAQAPSTYTVK